MRRLVLFVAALTLVGLISRAGEPLQLGDAQLPAKLLNATDAEVAALIAKSNGTGNKAALSALKRFAAMQSQLRKCLGDTEDHRGLANGILNGALSNPCFIQALSGESQAYELADEVSDISASIGFDSFKEAAQNIALRGTAQSAAEYRTRFEGGLKSPNGAELIGLAKKYCESCNENQLKIFRESFRIRQNQNETAIASNKLERYYLEQIRTSQNQMVEGLNRKTDVMIAAKQAGDDAKLNDVFKASVASYTVGTASPIGQLFTTDAMRAYVGKPVAPDDIQKSWGYVGSYGAPKLKLLPPTPDGCKAAVNRCGEGQMAIHNSLVEMDTKIAQMSNAVADSKDMKDLLKANPALVGQVLLSQPKMLPVVCLAIKDISNTDWYVATGLKGLNMAFAAADVINIGLLAVDGVGIGTTMATMAAKKVVRETAEKHFLSAVGSLATKEGLSTVYGGAAASWKQTAINGASRRLAGFATRAGSAAQLAQKAVATVEVQGLQDEKALAHAALYANTITTLDQARVNELEQRWDSAIATLSLNPLDVTPLAGAPLMKKLMEARNFKVLNGSTLEGSLKSQNSFYDMATGLGKAGYANLETILDKAKNSEASVKGLTLLSGASATVQKKFARIMSGGGPKAEKLMNEIGEDVVAVGAQCAF